MSHQQITKSVWRSKHVHKCLITKISSLSSRVKEITLEPLENEPNISFKPGQWCDFISTVGVGGFSFINHTNPPILAIRLSRDPVTQWIHNTAKIGDNVDIRVGGDFYLRPTMTPILFLAAGMGITPIHSMLSYLSTTDLDTHLMYSYREGLYLDNLKKFSKRIDFRDTTVSSRFNSKDIQDASKNVGQVYLCGPSQFEEFVLKSLDAVGFPQEHVYFEKWW